MRKITYVTGNLSKVAWARQVLEPLGYQVDNIKMDTPEIQADDVSEVAKYSAKWAAEKLNIPVLKNDSGLFVNWLNWFPWVYTHYVEDTLWVDGLLKLMEWLEDRSAYFKEAIAYCEPGQEPILFEWIVKGTIDVKKSGAYGWSRDFVYIPDWETQTLWCFPDEERIKFWGSNTYKQLAQYLDKHGK